jgi:hypothetical protein
VYYVAASAAVDAAYTQWLSASAGVTDPSRLFGPAATYAGALTTFDNEIVDIGATGSAASDIAILASDDQVMVTDLNRVSSVTAAELPTWEAQLTAAHNTAITQDDIVRSDLGLPPS